MCREAERRRDAIRDSANVTAVVTRNAAAMKTQAAYHYREIQL